MVLLAVYSGRSTLACGGRSGLDRLSRTNMGIAQRSAGRLEDLEEAAGQAAVWSPDGANDRLR